MSVFALAVQADTVPRVADIRILPLPRRVLGLLAANGITDTDELTALNARELLGFDGVGRVTLTAIQRALEEADLKLAVDPYASYVCARHGDASWDSNLSSLFLCDDCAAKWQEEAFGGVSPAYIGDRVGGYCLNCNVEREDVRLRQWFLCGTCERVARSIGRSVVAERYVAERWKELVAPHVPQLRLVRTDEPALRRRERDAASTKRAEIDFVALGEDDSARIGFELKTGKSYISGSARVGAKMGEFQLDTSDCDDIATVMEREGIPVYLLHVQVIDRAFPPTVQYVALGGWWTDVFRMHEHVGRVQRRSREARDAAYFRIGMFEDLETFGEYVANAGHEELAERLRREGIPPLYER